MVYCWSVCCFSKNLPKGEIVVPLDVASWLHFMQNNLLQHDMVLDVLTYGPKSYLSDTQCCEVVNYGKFVICVCFKYFLSYPSVHIMDVISD